MNKIFFTSDLHFNHANVIGHSNRPYGSVVDMNHALVDNWNSLVTPSDVVYVLGDFALSYGKKATGNIQEIFESLVGQKHLIIGNHDHKEIRKLPWASVDYYKEIKVDLGDTHKQRIVLSHYAHKVWNQMHRGSWMLHGHSHGNLVDTGGRILDMGVDCWSYFPVEIKDLKVIMDNREIITHDHHREGMS